MVWATTALYIGYVFIIHFDDIYDYRYVKTITLIDLISIDANFVNFMIMASILFRSSQVATLNHEKFEN